MAGREGKFGTFGGVYTPSVLTILGVIMYLRLPWVVGNAGLVAAMGIILVAHVISVSTGLSISSIATDKNVGAGGPYYIVSRSLGLPIGGTLGLALFVGLSFSISLYIIGFCESFLSYWELGTSIQSVRLAGTITLVALTVVTFISTALAIKTQYLILTLIAASLVSIFLGTPEPVAAQPHMEAPENAASLPVLFGVFFPAVTGFTAGVNMSGDLLSPKKSIPQGTMLSIATGLAVYMGLAIYLAYRVPFDQLRNDPNVLLSISAVDYAVVAGIWGATLSSALGSILGAPRILQAVAGDGILSRLLAKGVGKTNEPRNALFVAFAIAEAGILIGELNAIARVVSMVFLATYGFLNVSCAIESWASPDFRPDFKIPKTVSVIGAVVSVVIMIYLDLPAMIGATAIMTGVFLWLSRRQLRLESGDTWEGIWSSLVRSGLFRLSSASRQQRNWRPNILAFGRTEGDDGLEAIGPSLLGRNGMLTYVDFVDKGAAPKATRAKRSEEPPLGVFRRRVVSEDPLADVTHVARFHGLSGLEPNTVLLDWDIHGADTPRLAELIGELARADLNQLVYRFARREAERAPRIDIWWRDGGGNLPLAVSLVRFLTASPRYESATIRFLLLSDDPASNDVLRTTTRRYLADMRVVATIRVVNTTLETRGFDEWVRQESSDASLVILALPNEAGKADADFLSRMSRLFESLGETLLIRPGSTFPEVLSAGRPASISLLPAAPGTVEERIELPPVELPPTPDLARNVEALTVAYRDLVFSFDENCVARIYGQNIELVRRIQRALEKQLEQMDKGLAKANVRRQQHIVNRAQSSFLMEADQILEKFESTELPEQQATFEARIEAFLQCQTVIERDEHTRLSVDRDRDDFAPARVDAPIIRSIKRRRRFFALLRRGAPVRYTLPVGKLKAYYFDAATRVVLRDTVRRMVADAHQLAVHLGKLLSSSKTSLTLAAEELSEGGAGASALGERRNRIVRRFEELVSHHKDRVEEHRAYLLSQTAMLLDAYARDIERIDVEPLVHRERKRPADHDELRADLESVASLFVESQARLFERASLAVRVSGFQHRLITVVERQKEAMSLDIKNGVASDYRVIQKRLAEFAQSLKATSTNDVPRPKFSLEFDNRTDAKEIIDTLSSEATQTTQELPETVRTLSDESIQALEEGRLTDTEVIDLSVRRLATFLIETELIGPVQEMLAKLPHAERRAITLAQDVVRLVTFQLSEFDSLGAAQPGDLATHMLPVVENGLERLEETLTELDAAVPELSTTIDAGLEAILDGTNAYELTHSSARLEQYIRLHQSKKAVSEAQGAIKNAVAKVKGAMVATLYRASAGVVLARKLGQRSELRGSLVDRVLDVVQHNTPNPDVLSSLPFYYHQLFLGQSLNETFWVAREAQMNQARRALSAYRRGAHGAIIVTGDPGSGKTAIIQRMMARLLDKRGAYVVRAQPGGSVVPAHFERALCKAVDTATTLQEALERIPEQSAIIIDDLELWWERREGGFAVIDSVIDLIRKHGHRYLFVLGVGRQALSLMDRVKAVTDGALSVVECDPVPAEALGQIIMLRHGSTGMKFEIAGRPETELSQWQLARLFSSHFRYSRGLVGASLVSWLVHIDKVSKSRLTVRSPKVLERHALDDLPIEYRALLLQLVLHKRMSQERLERVTGVPKKDLEQDLAALSRMGLLTDSRGIYEVNRYIEHLLMERFELGGLI